MKLWLLHMIIPKVYTLPDYGGFSIIMAMIKYAFLMVDGENGLIRATNVVLKGLILEIIKNLSLVLSSTGMRAKMM